MVRKTSRSNGCYGVGDASQREVDAHSVIGCAKRFSLGAIFASTDEVMELLREGEQ